MRVSLWRQGLLLCICLICFSLTSAAEEVNPLKANGNGEETRRNSLSEEEVQSEGQCKVTNVFVETDLRQALMEISTQCGVPILVDDAVQGYVSSLEVEDMPIEECLGLILKPGGYFFKRIDNYYIVSSSDPLSPLFSQIARTERIRPQHLKAKDIFPLLPGFFSTYIKIDNITNSLIITALPETIEKIKEHIFAVDFSPPQVMIEAVITQISSIGSKKLGIDWALGLNKNKDPEGLYSGAFEVQGLSAALQYINPKRTLQEVTATLKQLVEEGEAKIKASPRLVALNGETADIYIGKEKYYILQPPSGVTYAYSRFESIKTGITLKITPYVYESGEINVTIEPEVSDVLGEGVEESPVISRRKAKTTVTVMNGQPIVIGGLQMTNKSEVKSGLWCLGSIPILGWLFQTRRKSLIQNEVVIIVTPHIYSQLR